MWKQSEHPAPPKKLARLLRLFSVPIIMQEQEEKAYQHGKETKHWLPSQTPGEVPIPAWQQSSRPFPVFFQWHVCFS